MMKIKLMKALFSYQTLWNFADFLKMSFIKGPAFCLLFFAAFLYFHGELTLSLVESSRQLLSGAAPDTVLVCRNSAETYFTEPYFTSPAHCEREAVALKPYADAADAKALSFYLSLVKLSALLWLVTKAVLCFGRLLPERKGGKFPRSE